MLEAHTTPSAIPSKPGATVVYLHKWRGFRNKEIGPCFTPIAVKTLRRMQPGSLVWVDTDPMHMQGKVYGYTLVTIGSITDRGNGKFWISFNGGGSLVDGNKTKQHKFMRVQAPVRLEGLLRDNPDATKPAHEY
ncbi:MAG: hypothetical protein HQ488_05150 [Parcubacteria group bacterium]|nr:hypothetical protein [Parcubacteria group bacterium]